MKYKRHYITGEQERALLEAVTKLIKASCRKRGRTQSYNNTGKYRKTIAGGSRPA